MPRKQVSNSSSGCSSLRSNSTLSSLSSYEVASSPPPSKPSTSYTNPEKPSRHQRNPSVGSYMSLSTSSSATPTDLSTISSLSPPNFHQHSYSLTSSITNQLLDYDRDSQMMDGHAFHSSHGDASWNPGASKNGSSSPSSNRKKSHHQRSSSSSDPFHTFQESNASSSKSRRNRSGSFSSLLAAFGASSGQNEAKKRAAAEEKRRLQMASIANNASSGFQEHTTSSSSSPVRNRKPTSFHSNITLNSNYRQSVSFVKQQYHLYKIFLIGHLQSSDITTKSGSNTSQDASIVSSNSSTGGNTNTFTSPLSPGAFVNSRKNYTLYLIEVHHKNRSILVSRRYSEFFQLYKYLKQKYPSYPFSIPPKKLMGSMSIQTIEKRKLGLKQLLWEVKQICGFSEESVTASALPQTEPASPATPSSPSDEATSSLSTSLFTDHSAATQENGSLQSTSTSSITSPQRTRDRGVSKNSLPHQPYMWYQDAVIQEFFHINTFHQFPIYQVPDSVWSHIFRYLGFYDLYRNLALTSKWLTRILYNQLKQASFTYLNHEVYFQSVPVAIDTNDELFDLILRFAGLQSVSLERFHTIDGNFVQQLIRRKAAKLKYLSVRNCSLGTEVNLAGFGNQLLRISFAYCKQLKSLILCAPSKETAVHHLPKCSVLDLSGTAVNDDSLQSMVKYLPHLETLILRSCSELSKVHLGTGCKLLKKLDLSFCFKMKSLKLSQCRNLTSLRVDYTSIENESLQDVVDHCAEHLQICAANTCINIRGLKFSEPALNRSIQRMEFAGCVNLVAQEWELSECSNLEFVDFRLTPLSEEQVRTLLDAGNLPSLKTAYCDEKKIVGKL